MLERRAASGTFIPGGAQFFDGAHLIFDGRARREDSFGGRLVEKLSRRLERDGIKFRLDFSDALSLKIRRGFFPVLWESPRFVESCLKANRPAILLNDRPAPGLSATFLDSVSIDDFSGGAGAAQLLFRANENGKNWAIVGGLEGDVRSQMRVAGAQSVLKNASVLSAGGWYFEDGYRVAPQVLGAGGDGIFCANDRLAHAISTFAREENRKLPTIVGFDDAPIAEKIGLTTMAIPWDELIFEAAQIIKKRMNGDNAGARQLILTPRPIVRN